MSRREEISSWFKFIPNDMIIRSEKAGSAPRNQPFLLRSQCVGKLRTVRSQLSHTSRQMRPTLRPRENRFCAAAGKSEISYDHGYHQHVQTACYSWRFRFSVRNCFILSGASAQAENVCNYPIYTLNFKLTVLSCY